MAKHRTPLPQLGVEPRGRQAILRSEDEVATDDRLLESQNAGPLELRGSRTPEEARRPQLRQDGKPDRAAYPKATYRISPAAIDAIDDARRALRRQYGIKASLEEIAEVAIIATCQELTDNQLSSILVRQLAGDQDRHEAG